MNKKILKFLFASFLVLLGIKDSGSISAKALDANKFLCGYDENTKTLYLTSDESLKVIQASYDEIEKSPRCLLDYSGNTTKVVVQNQITFGEDQAAKLFQDFTKLEEIENLNYLDISNATNVMNMFSFCSSLKEIDLSSFSTTNVTTCNDMFRHCTSLVNLDLSNFDLSNATSLEHMLSEATGIKTLKTPLNLTQDVELPVNKMYDSDGNEYTQLPKEKSESITLMSNFRPVNNGDDFISAISNLKDGTIKLFDDISINTSLLQVGQDKELNIDLNGHIINGNNVSTIFNVGKLNVIDTCENPIEYYWTSDNTGKWVKKDSKPNGVEGRDYFVTTGGCIFNMNATGNAGMDIGGAFLNFGTLTIDNVDLIGNQAGMGGAIYNINYSNGFVGDLVVKNSQISGNTANVGAGIVNKESTEISNSIISHNVAKEAAGIFTETYLKLIDTTVTKNITNDSIDNNYPSAGVYAYGKSGNSGTVVVKGKVVISDNKSCNLNANLVIAGKTAVQPVDLLDGSHIGITKLDGEDNIVMGEFSMMSGSQDAEYFVADQEMSIIFNGETDALTFVEKIIENDPESLTPGAVVGIATGSVAGVCLLSYIAMFFVWKKNAKALKFLEPSFKWLAKLFTKK